ncbi:putative membrane protein [Paenibacillus sp. DS2015]|uniref:LiaF transmembrane domain-containing protein n=1 Tax=Paenibacillus sp. DS2015 TaxID=3373917 RepID=UPI003D23F8C3
MQTKRGNGLAVVLIFIGALMLMGLFGPLLGRLFGLLFPILMIALGYYGIRRGKVVIGWIILAIGLMALISKLAWFIGPLLGIILLVYGISLFKKKRITY